MGNSLFMGLPATLRMLPFAQRGQEMEGRVIGAAFAIKISQVVECGRYLSVIGLRVFLRKLTVGLQRLGIFLASLLHSALVAVKIPKVVKRHRYVRPIKASLTAKTLVRCLLNNSDSQNDRFRGGSRPKSVTIN